jgi:hypothetical protein
MASSTTALKASSIPSPVTALIEKILFLVAES